jgi:hypothetical protein
MKIVEKTAGRLVLQEKPWLVLAIGTLFIVTGIVMAIRTGELLAGGFAILGALLILFVGNTVTATFDANVGRFTRTTRGIVRNSQITHPLQEIAGASVESSRSGRPSRSYRVALTLSSGARVPLTTSYSSGKDDKEQTAGAIREFLHLPAPEPGMPGFGEMVGLMFAPDAAERLSHLLDGPVDDLEQARAHVTAARDMARSRGDHAQARTLDLTLQKLMDRGSRPR